MFSFVTSCIKVEFDFAVRCAPFDPWLIDLKAVNNILVDPNCSPYGTPLQKIPLLLEAD